MYLFKCGLTIEFEFASLIYIESHFELVKILQNNKILIESGLKTTKLNLYEMMSFKGIAKKDLHIILVANR
jgi:hypothetical protein